MAASVMSPEVLAAVGSLGAALAGGFVGRKTASGRVDKTDATRLWEEAAAIRRDLNEQILQLRREVESKDDHIRDLQNQIHESLAEKAELQLEIATLRREVADLRVRVSASESRL